MDVIAIMNTVRANSSATYQQRIPELNRTNLEQLRFAMVDDDNVMVANEFIANLLNKVFRTDIHAKMFNNPLKALKRGKKYTGDTVEEIYVNFAKGQKYNGDSGADLMKRTLPDIKTVYHRMNHQMTYPVTIGQQQLSKAFSSFEALETFMSNIINSLYNGAELDEFMNMKQLIASALSKNAMKVVEVADPLTSEANAKAFIKAVKTVSGLMAFPNSDWNAYTTAQATDDKPIITVSKKNEQVLILDTATDTGVSVDVLAATFNMSVADFNDTRKIVIDCFPDASIRAALVDESFFQVWDDAFVFKKFENGMSLYDNYYLHVWQTHAFSILCNAVCFKVAAE